MNQSKLVKMLKLLDSDEIKAFRRHLQTPVFHSGTTLLKLLDVLKPHHRSELKNPGLTKERVYKKVFPGKPFNPGKLKRHMSELTRELVHFMALLELQKDEVTEAQLAGRFFKRKNARTFFHKSIENRLKFLENQPQTNQEKNYEYLSALFDLSYRSDKTGYGSDNEVFEKMAFHLDIFYAKARLFMFMEALNKKRIQGEEVEISLLGKILDYIKSRYSEPTTLLFSSVIELMQERGDFQNTKNRFLRQLKALDPEIARDILTSLRNYCTLAHKKEGGNHLSELARLNEIGLEHGLFIQGGYLPDHRFINIANTFSIVKQFERAEQFIENWQGALDEMKRERAVFIARQFLRFKKGEYETVHKAFHENPPDLYRFWPIWRNMDIACLYELGEEYIQLLHNKLKSYTVYFRQKKKISEENRISNLNFAKFTHRLLTGTAPEKAIRDIQNTRYVAFRDWLIEKNQALLNA
ncbi:MAG: hypothetical protein D6714_09160 [Bacteroidetes bacterium]|nr:MAG: hypothetical protein D6714_09160 [Bacteroidota bacterium]